MTGRHRPEPEVIPYRGQESSVWAEREHVRPIGMPRQPLNRAPIAGAPYGDWHLGREQVEADRPNAQIRPASARDVHRGQVVAIRAEGREVAIPIGAAEGLKQRAVLVAEDPQAVFAVPLGDGEQLSIRAEDNLSICVDLPHLVAITHPNDPNRIATKHQGFPIRTKRQAPYSIWQSIHQTTIRHIPKAHCPPITIGCGQELAIGAKGQDINYAHTQVTDLRVWGAWGRVCKSCPHPHPSHASGAARPGRACPRSRLGMAHVRPLRPHHVHVAGAIHPDALPTLGRPPPR